MPNLKPLFSVFPEAVLLLERGTAVYLNEAARSLIPGLEPGAPLPASLALLATAGPAAGVFTEGDAAFSFSASRSGEENLVIFRPAPAPALTLRELEGTARSLRGLLGDFAAELGPLTGPDAQVPSADLRGDIAKSFHRLVRLVNNLDFLRAAAGPDGAPFHRAAMDLAGLCRGLAQTAGDLLRQAGVTLWYDAQVSSLLVPGDPALLQRLLLGLISNSAQVAGKGGNVTLTLRVRGERAMLTLTDSGDALDRRTLDALLQRERDGVRPLPGQGAGMGLDIARRIAALHQGALLVDLGVDNTPTLLLSLPTGPLPAGVTVRTPPADETGGFDPFLVELSDVLPSQLYGLEGIE